MSTLPEITQALCTAIARGEYDRLRGLCFQAAAKMGGDRGQRIVAAFEKVPAVAGPPLVHWHLVNEPRSPWRPYEVECALSSWLQEAQYAETLAASGERVRPLLLSGPTRCGKTSSAASLASGLGLPVYRLDLAEAVDSHLGETSKKLRKALAEMARPGLWLMDELDAIAGKRIADGTAAAERAHAIGYLLTALDQLPPGTLLVATTNTSENIDPAILGRFTEIRWPDWQSLKPEARNRFAESHGCETWSGSTYAEVVRDCRQQRVQRLIARAQEEAAE